MVRGIQPLSVMRDAWFRCFAPRSWLLGVVPSQRFHPGRDDATQFLKPASPVVVRCQPWFYLRLVAYCFFGLSEGA